MLRKALSNLTYTENGALTYVSTLNPLLDFYYHSGAKRGQTEQVVQLFAKAYEYDPVLAIVALFSLRNVRGGKGERDLFRACLEWLKDKPEFDSVIHLVPHYGRWDDLLQFHDKESVVKLIAEQLKSDLESRQPSLLAKWMPSNRTSSKSTMHLAYVWRKALDMSSEEYQYVISGLRERLNVVERHMSANQWHKINYGQVPSRAGMIYRKAFLRRDKERYEKFIANVNAGRAKINAGTLYPYELVYRCRKSDTPDSTVEALWKALPDDAQGKTGLVVCDVSGSMTDCNLPGSSAQPIDVSVSLAIYFAQRNTGIWKDALISFDAQPYFVDLSDCDSLFAAALRVLSGKGVNTNIQAVFDLVLAAAIKHGVPQSEMPVAIWIVSDMEFDRVAGPRTNIDAIRQKYTQCGYDMPVLIFWNVASRKLQTPALGNDPNVVLVSGFSPYLFGLALENPGLNPEKAMKLDLMSEKYLPVFEALGLTNGS